MLYGNPLTPNSSFNRSVEGDLGRRSVLQKGKKLPNSKGYDGIS
jgi:hypothetical protein